jgi:hypothetical protein
LLLALLLLAGAIAFFWPRGEAPTAASPTATAAETAAGPAATPAPLPAFSYTFDDGNSEGWTGDPAEWAVIQDETGNYIYQGTAPPDSDTASELPNKFTMATWRNYAVHLHLRVHQEGNNPDVAEFWLTTRAPLEDTTGCSFYNSFLDFRNQVVVLAKGGNDASCEYTVIEDNGFPLLTVGEWYEVVVTMQDDQLSLVIDGNEVIVAQDGDVQQGYAYLNVGPGAIVQFDDVVVYKLD